MKYSINLIGNSTKNIFSTENLKRSPLELDNDEADRELSPSGGGSRIHNDDHDNIVFIKVVSVPIDLFLYNHLDS